MSTEKIDRIKNQLRLHKDYNHTALTGKTITVEDDSGKEVKLTIGRLDRAKEARLKHDGFALLMGEVITASGHHFHALIEVSYYDSCEHYGSYLIAVYEEDGNMPYGAHGVHDPEDTFVPWMQSVDPSFELFPYRYRYRDILYRERDHHVDDDGWSR